MLLRAFEALEGFGATMLADRYFDEACSLGGVAGDDYGHIKRIHLALSKGHLADMGKSEARAQRLAQIWGALL
jgi:hypothetical protein